MWWKIVITAGAIGFSLLLYIEVKVYKADKGLRDERGVKAPARKKGLVKK